MDFFKALNDAGNFVPVIGKSGTLAQGATPIVVMWDYNALAAKDTLGNLFSGLSILADGSYKLGDWIVISGGGATNPMPNISAYAASKAAVVRLSPAQRAAVLAQAGIAPELLRSAGARVTSAVDFGDVAPGSLAVVVLPVAQRNLK